MITRCIDCDREFERGWDEGWKSRCLPCWRRWKGRTDPKPAHLPQPAPPIPPDIMRLLIQLVHPDRHGNSAASNRATAWLLAMRKERA